MIRAASWLLMVALSVGAAQRGQPGAAAAGPILPEVLPDGRVTLSLFAPKSGEVSLKGDWMPVGKGINMTRDAEGVWSITVGPLGAGFYSYWFIADGLRVAGRQDVFGGRENLFRVTGSEADLAENRDVPHGQLRLVWYDCKRRQSPRRLRVYTPPGYERGQERYPVLYLLPCPETGSGWSTLGRAGFIMDNLLAEGVVVRAKTVENPSRTVAIAATNSREYRIRPMLIVMPESVAPLDLDGEPAIPATAVPTAGTLDEQFGDELVHDIIPYVETNFRTLREGPCRALAGAGRGGRETLHIVARHAEEFAYVGIWSAGLTPHEAAVFEAQETEFLANAQRINRTLKHFSIAAGADDLTLRPARLLSDMLSQHGIEHKLRISEGGQSWAVWREYLGEFVPLLFN
jgi:enterochelin esterase family protein